MTFVSIIQPSVDQNSIFSFPTADGKYCSEFALVWISRCGRANFSYVLVRVVICRFSTAWGGSTPNPHVVHWTTVYGKRFMMKNWLMGLWRLRNPMIQVCKMEAQESWCCDSVQVQRPENQEHQCPQAEDRCPSSNREQIFPSSFFRNFPGWNWKLAFLRVQGE